MDLIGSPIESQIVTLSAIDWENRQELEASKFFEIYAQGLAKTLVTLREANKSGTLDILVKVEESLITMEHSYMVKKTPLSFLLSMPHLKTSQTLKTPLVL